MGTKNSVIRNEDIDYPIDELIRPAVDLLTANYFTTIESCQGGEGHAGLEPFVSFTGDEIDVIRAIDICIAHGMCVSEGRKVFRKIQDIFKDGEYVKEIGRTYERPYFQIIFYIHPETGTIFYPR